ncbi:MAG: flagellar hook-length control protein FliK [Candidatus Elarobacter sp.]
MNRLAGSLAASLAAMLGISVDSAKARLTQVFTEALASPAGTGPPTDAQRASTLVARFRQMAELATRVANGDQGQPIRSIAGNSLDANSAKATPAPSPDSILRDALAALATPASPLVTARAVATPLTAANASDGRTVASAPLEAISSAGDTPLGRILTRAVLADPSRSASSAATSEEAHSNALDAFVHAFTSALARESPRATPNRDGGEPTATVGFPSQPPSAATSRALPFAIPVARDVAAIAPPVPASSLPQSAQQPVDPNAIVDQVLRGISLRTADGSSTLRLRLVPENLGDVSITLVVNGGRVDASITAHSVDAQSALAGGQNQLARTLAEAGLKLQSFSVGLAGGAFADARDQANQRSWTRSSSRRIGGVDAADVDEPGDSSLLAVPSFGPPIYTARPDQWGVEYLV